MDERRKIINCIINNIIFLYLILKEISFINCEYNIIVFNSQEYRAGQFAFNSNRDMIIEYSKNYYRLFYGLKKNGKYYFENNTSTKEITIGDDSNGAKRYESRNIFISINDQYYLFSIGTFDSITELHNLETGDYLSKTTSDFLGSTTIYSYVFSLLEINNNDNKEYIIAYIYNKSYYLKKFSFSEFTLELTLTSISNVYTFSYDNRIVNCFIMNSKIFLFFVNSDLKYEIYIYDFSLNKLNSNSIIIDSIYNFNQGYGVFSKCYNIIDNLAIFIYYTNPNTKILKLKIGKIDSDYVFNEMLTKEISEYTFQIDVLLNDFVKVNEERFIYIGLSESTFDTIFLLLFDLYNNYNNMKIRLYEINLNNKYEVNIEFSIDIYNNILALISTVVNKGSSSQLSIFMLFGYANGTDSFIDTPEYFMEDYINSSKNTASKLFENIIIENNIFGYELINDKIILSSIPNEILFYNKTNENIKLENEDFLDKLYIKTK